MEQVKNRTILRFSNDHFEQIQDSIVVEHPVTIKINGNEFMTIVCTPEYIEDMVVGFLASERVIGKYEEIKKVWVQEELGFVHIETDKLYPFYEKLHSKRYITSCCGMGRQGFVFANDALTAKKMTSTSVTLTPEECFTLMKEMDDSAEMFHHTGGVHNASLCDQNGIVLSRMDIGRHNALDKIYGYCLKHNISVHNKVIVFSGRISSEILLKVAKIGCEIILSKSAPTNLALELAEELGITTVGFIRNNSFNLYTHPERIII
ncbi:formate dehydrogenase accessory sulfurtransferase FdhD [Sporosarcina sp. G11-34]|uniref:formate dehydrogenase accessory sulfurtransferase FdhD n=1 Tax=Sporosarcina sp. G11-34 TaxID=2849605 RepID=UPI0022A9050C|nr:formate dehydrogenase accessory sulfurtransferase FdhD [Sporosarcina sp. G11-34]MCZ2258338.1 formate dehydrogenase accessory sulfurtransferase FdhD [Sporosarcina sp. G11-34]